MCETTSSITLDELSRVVLQRASSVSFNPAFCGGARLQNELHIPKWRRVEDHHLILVVQSGEISIEYSTGRTHCVGPGGAFYLAPSRRPTVTFRALTTYHECYFRPEPAIEVKPGFALAPSADELSGLLQTLGDILQSDRPSALWQAQIWLGAALEGFLNHRTESVGKERTNRQLQLHQRRILSKWLGEHIHENPTPADLAQLLQLCPDYFTRIFRSTYGLAPKSWLARQRIREAIRLLEQTPLNVAQIADKLNYADSVHFCRKFKEVTGLSPLNYRKQSG
jgi:AraC-like DNA-binding protein